MYAYDQAAGLRNSAGQTWDEASDAAYKNWEVGGPWAAERRLVVHTPPLPTAASLPGLLH